jgi:hypothetical protein
MCLNDNKKGILNEQLNRIDEGVSKLAAKIENTDITEDQWREYEKLIIEVQQYMREMEEEISFS